MRYISLFSGIEAASVAWEPLGWEPVCFSEIEPFPCAVLQHRFPNVPNYGDITKIDWKEVLDRHGAVDLVIGGSPCQSFSIAGGRASLDGESALCFEYYRAVRDIRPRWFVWENVPGVFSTRDNAFGQFLHWLEELGYGMAWRTLDAQFFGVAQRRRRVFLVGCAGGAVGRAAAVLFERDSVSGNTKTSREKREELTRAASFGAGFCIQGGGRTSLNSNGDGIETDGSCYTLNCVDRHAVLCMASGHTNAEIGIDLGTTMSARQYKDPPIIIDRAAFNQGGAALFAPHIEKSETMDPLVARGPHAVCVRRSGRCAPETTRESETSTSEKGK